VVIRVVLATVVATVVALEATAVVTTVDPLEDTEVVTKADTRAATRAATVEVLVDTAVGLVDMEASKVRTVLLKADTTPMEVRVVMLHTVVSNKEEATVATNTEPLVARAHSEQANNRTVSNLLANNLSLASEELHHPALLPSVLEHQIQLALKDRDTVATPPTRLLSSSLSLSLSLSRARAHVSLLSLFHLQLSILLSPSYVFSKSNSLGFHRYTRSSIFYL